VSGTVASLARLGLGEELIDFCRMVPNACALYQSKGLRLHIQSVHRLDRSPSKWSWLRVLWRGLARGSEAARHKIKPCRLISFNLCIHVVCTLSCVCCVFHACYVYYDLLASTK
jgi:hypothetical protein